MFTNFKSISFSIVLVVLLTISASSQVFQQWVQRYNGQGNDADYANSIAADGSGNIYVTGSTFVSNGNRTDYTTMKYNSQSVLLWNVRYNGTGDYIDEANAIAVDESGNVYVTGRSWGNVYEEHDYVTIKYNSAGVQQWSARYKGPAVSWMDEAFAIAIWAGNVYVTGRSEQTNGNYDYATVKYNSAGVQQWAVRYSGPGNAYDGGSAIGVDNSGNVYVTGGSAGNGTSVDYTTIKYNSAGVQQWVQRYNGPGNAYDAATSLKVDASGNVYVTGESWGSGTSYDYATIKYNTSGVQQWVIRYNGAANGFDQAHSLAVDGVGNVFVTGGSQGSNGMFDYATVKYSSLGFEQWASRYNGPGNANDIASSIVIDGSNQIYVTGRSVGSGTDYDYATIKYNNVGGIQQWLQRYNGLGNSSDYASSLALDGSGSVYVTGYSTGSGTNYDYATIRYSQLTGINNTNNETPQQFSLEQNYPNPFNPSTKIRFSVAVKENVSIKIYDINGKEVSVLLDEVVPAGNYETDFDGSKLSSGTYFYKIVTASGFVSTKKMTLVK